MYRKYVRNWWLLKRNRIICPEKAVTSQFLPGKSIFFLNLPWKIVILYKITWKKSQFFANLPWKIDFFVKLHETKSKFLGNFPRISKFFVILPKNRNFCETYLENRNILGNCLKKSKFFENLTWKIQFFGWNYLKNRNFSEICPEKSIFCV